MDEVIEPLSYAYHSELFRIGETPVTVATLATSIALLIISTLVAKVGKRAIHQLLLRYKVEERQAGTIASLLHYAMLVIGAATALQVSGIDLSALFAAGAFLAVGLGLALQSISQNFVSGIILLSERSIKPGDVLKMEGDLVRVADMGIRASIVRSRDGEEMIVPNSVLSQSAVRNLTLTDHVHRIRVGVGVAYDSDMEQVLRVLCEVAESHQHKLLSARGRAQVGGERGSAWMVGFGSSSVDFEVGVWSDSPWEMPLLRSELLLEIWRALKQEEIVIAYPQLDLHLDPGVVASMGRAPGSTHSATAS